MKGGSETPARDDAKVGKGPLDAGQAVAGETLSLRRHDHQVGVRGEVEESSSFPRAAFRTAVTGEQGFDECRAPVLFRDEELGGGRSVRLGEHHGVLVGGVPDASRRCQEEVRGHDAMVSARRPHQVLPQGAKA
ncbi:MAG: hypothetical protein ACRDL8_08740, partial [Solirubrobacteraceae bacterium]